MDCLCLVTRDGRPRNPFTKVFPPFRRTSGGEWKRCFDECDLISSIRICVVVEREMIPFHPANGGTKFKWRGG